MSDELGLLEPLGRDVKELELSTRDGCQRVARLAGRE